MHYIEIVNWAKYQHYKDRNPSWIKLHRDMLNDYEFTVLPDNAKAHLVLIWLLASQMDNKIPDDAEFIKRRIGANSKVDLDLFRGKFIAPWEEKVEVGDDWGTRYIPAKLKAAVLKHFNHQCNLCGSGKDLEIDHIHPISRGGTSTAENLQVLCISCNRKKRTIGGEAFMLQNSGLLRSKPLQQFPDERSLETETERETEREKIVQAPKKIASLTEPENFTKFWEAYPKKQGKQDALKAWLRILPESALLETILDKLAIQKQTIDWKKDGGQYIPLPATYINAKRWEDILKVEVGKAPTSGTCMVDKKPATKMRGKKNWWLCDECAEVFKRTAGDHVFYADWSELTPEQIEKRVLEFKAKRKD